MAKTRLSDSATVVDDWNVVGTTEPQIQLFLDSMSKCVIKCFDSIGIVASGTNKHLMVVLLKLLSFHKQHNYFCNKAQRVLPVI